MVVWDLGFERFRRAGGSALINCGRPAESVTLTIWALTECAHKTIVPKEMQVVIAARLSIRIPDRQAYSEEELIGVHRTNCLPEDTYPVLAHYNNASSRAGTLCKALF